MANRLKSDKRTSKKKPDQLKPEKEAQVKMKELVRDERTHKIAGSLLILLAAFLFIAFTSYIFTWKQDQDKVFRQGAAVLLPSANVKTSNLLGNIGAYVSHQFFYNGFGLASFAFCTFFFTLGANFLTGRRIFSIKRNLRYVLLGGLLLSVSLAFLAGNSSFSWGGAVGKMISDWLTRLLGIIGTASLLLVIYLAYFIWRFNPVFRVPKLPSFEKSARLTIDDSVVEAENETQEAETPNRLKNPDAAMKGTVDPEANDFDENILLTEREDDSTEELADKLAADAPMTVHEMLQRGMKPNEPGSDAEDTALPEEPTEEAEADVVPVPPKTGRNKQADAPDLQLEIKNLPELIEEAEQDAVEEPVPAAKINLEPYEPTLDLRDYKYPTLDLLETHGTDKIVQDSSELESNKNQIITTLKNYDIAIQKISATVGPTVTLYEIVPAPGVRISRIKNLEDDIALSLAALGIRIIAPIPGKGTIGIEVPNVKKSIVGMKTMLSSEKFQHNHFSLPIAIGKKIDNENFIVDLATMPHLLMAGATGQGKSVGLNAILVSLLYKKHPSQLKLVLVDPKKVELSLYRTIERHFLAKLPGEEEAIITDTKKVIHTLNALCIEMDTRYDLLKEAGARNIKEYNEKFIKRRLNPEKGHQFLPFIVLVIDEFADLIMTAGKEVEMPIARLAQLARAVGIHLIIATQRPSVNIITGTIKANFPARIAFKVSSKVDSRTILDTGGAEQLIGKGDMLISYNGELTRLQCVFVDTPEVDNVCAFIGDQRGYPQAFLLPEYVDEKDMEGKDFDLGDRDALFEEAARLIVQSQVGSTSLLQRRMKLGYNRAGRLMDQLEMAGVVGPNQGSKARDVLIKTEVDLEQLLGSMG